MRAAYPASVQEADIIHPGGMMPIPGAAALRPQAMTALAQRVT